MLDVTSGSSSCLWLNRMQYLKRCRSILNCSCVYGIRDIPINYYYNPKRDIYKLLPRYDAAQKAQLAHKPEQDGGWSMFTSV